MTAGPALTLSDGSIEISQRYEALVIGVSAGSLPALETILCQLPGNYSLAVMIVQHRHKQSDDYIYRYLNELCALEVHEAEEKSPIKAGHVYVAPPDYHLQVEADLSLSLSVDLPVNYSRPSIDILFETAAEVYRHRLVAVILTGANKDGSKGLAKVRKFGGLAIVQDPKTATAAKMPETAIKVAGADYILILEDIGHFLSQLKSPD
jgi:two-component system chemotaxis response regulator CheB